MGRIIRGIKTLLGLDTFGLKEAEGVYKNGKGKFSPEEIKVINFGVVQGAEAMGHRVTIQEDAQAEREAMAAVAQSVTAEAETFAEKTARKEAELLRKAAALRREAAEVEASAVAVATASKERIEKVNEVQKAFSF